MRGKVITISPMFLHYNCLFFMIRSEDGEMSVRYRQHSNIGDGKVVRIGHISQSNFSPVIVSAYGSSGKWFIMIFDIYKILFFRSV